MGGGGVLAACVSVRGLSASCSHPIHRELRCLVGRPRLPPHPPLLPDCPPGNSPTVSTHPLAPADSWPARRAEDPEIVSVPHPCVVPVHCSRSERSEHLPGRNKPMFGQTRASLRVQRHRIPYKKNGICTTRCRIACQRPWLWLWLWLWPWLWLWLWLCGGACGCGCGCVNVAVAV